MRRHILPPSLLTFVLLLIAPHASAQESTAPWRPLPLVTNNAIDAGWSMLGYGGFIVDDGALRTAPDERGMGLLVFTPEKFGNCRIRVVYKTQTAKSNSGLYVRIDD